MKLPHDHQSRPIPLTVVDPRLCCLVLLSHFLISVIFGCFRQNEHWPGNVPIFMWSQILLIQWYDRGNSVNSPQDFFSYRMCLSRRVSIYQTSSSLPRFLHFTLFILPDILLFLWYIHTFWCNWFIEILIFFTRPSAFQTLTISIPCCLLGINREILYWD